MTSAPTIHEVEPSVAPSERARGRPSKGLAYAPALDGLRAIAVLLVMLYHGGVSWAHGGFLGVDMFFVLSGYLITTLLLLERRRWGSVDLGAFWLRRARRLLPALFVMVAAVGLAAPLFAQPDALASLRGDGLATLGYVANWRFIVTGQSYFAHFAAPSPYRHMWSLGVEEQWYWLYPLVLVAVVGLAARRRRRTALLITCLALASSAWTVWLWRHGASTSRLYYGTDVRVQELLVGAVLGILVLNSPGRSDPERSSPGRVRELRTAAGLLIVGLAVAFAREGSVWLFGGGFLVLAVGVALVLDGVRRRPDGWTGRALSWHPLVWVGVISYGLYLWHWPVFLAMTTERTHLNGLELLLARFTVTFVIATLSYVVLERPIRRGWLGRTLPTSGIVLVSVGSVVVVVICLFAGTRGAVAGPTRGTSGALETRVADARPGQHSLLVVGDSPGRFLSWYLPRDILHNYAISESTAIGCGLLPQTVVVGNTVTDSQPQCDGWLDAWREAATKAHPDVVVLSAGYWELFDKKVDGRIVRVGTPEHAADLLAKLEQARTATTGGKVPMLLLNAPCFRQPSWVVDGAELQPVIMDVARQREINQIFATFAARHPDTVKVLDYRSFLCPGGTFQERIDGVDVRPDGVHVGGAGGRVVGQWLLPYLDAAVKNEASRS